MKVVLIDHQPKTSGSLVNKISNIFSEAINDSFSDNSSEFIFLEILNWY